MAGGCVVCVNYLLFFFNFVILVLDIALFALGINIHVQLGDYTELVSGVPYLTVATFFIIVTAFILFTVFCGCCGACKEDPCMLVTFFIIGLLIFVCELAAGIMAFMYKDKLTSETESEMYDSMELYNTSSSISTAWDTLQSTLHCCGTNSTDNWGDWDIDTPDSCCVDKIEGCAADGDELWEDSCYSMLYKEISSDLMNIGGVGLGVVSVQLMNMIFSWCLWCAIRRGNSS